MEHNLGVDRIWSAKKYEKENKKCSDIFENITNLNALFLKQFYNRSKMI